MNDPVITTGIGGGVQPRLEINDFIQDPVQFSLYVLAIRRMYAADQNTPRSHFQIGGIHGKPCVPWDGVFPDVEPVDGQWRGYCTHGMVTFPTWHRPYVVLYEQILQKHAVEIAEEYTDPMFAAAAKILRVPYWDWAKPGGAVPPPQVISDQYLNILQAPDGAPGMVENPLLKYTFHPIDNSFCPPIFTSPFTLRHPVPKLDAPGQYESDVDSLRRLFGREQAQITYSIYMMFIFLHSWRQFSNHTATNEIPPALRSASSLESIHDKIHRFTGNGGHMGDTSMAGFDPIFFLHHCNVDRMLSFWRALNPTKWVTPDRAEDGGSMTIPPDAYVDENTELTPFRANPSNPRQYWPSAALEATARFGYLYPEFIGLDPNDVDKVQGEIQIKINQLYGGAAIGSLSTGLPGVGETVIYDWATRVRVKQYELGTSFSVLIFIGGEVPENSTNRRFEDNYVGSFDTFVNSDTDQCENCRRQRDQELVVEGFVHLNLSIARLRGSESPPGSFHPDVIEPYLKNEGQVQWCIEKADGTMMVLTEENTSLEVTVIATPLTRDTSRGPGDTFPTAGEPTIYHGITAGRRGGSREVA